MKRKSIMMSVMPVLTLLLFFPLPVPAEQDPKIPGCLLCYRFGPEQHVLIVDKAAQELFVYSNYQPEPQARFKITTGKNHGPKFVEGDMRTPEGIYFFRRILSGDELPKTDDYGEKAFTMNYPNPIDIKQGKNGSGIWLHGASDPGKIKSPNNSRGCVVMKNRDLVELSKYIFLDRTPIFIFDKIKYETIENIEKKRERLIRHIKGWKSHWEDKNIDGYIGYYDPDFSYNGMNLQRFKAYKQRLNQRYRFIRVILSGINIYSFKNYRAALFNQLYISDLNHFYNRKIQYWQDSGEKAGIVAESGFQLPQPAKFEFSRGNYTTIEAFRKDYLEQMKENTVTFAPAEIRLTNVSIFGERVKLFLNSPGNPGDIRVIPVLNLQNTGDGSAGLKTLDGITMENGAPRGYSRAVAVEGRETTVVMKKDKESRLKSLTLFLVDPRDDVKQIITYFINQ